MWIKANSIEDYAKIEELVRSLKEAELLDDKDVFGERSINGKPIRIK